MPILTQCPYCQKKFRAADKVAGKPVKCPGCQGIVRVPAGPASQASREPVQPQPSDSSWYILSENGEKMGPVSKEQLDNLATKGRLSFCQLRRGDWQAWKWADDVYPELPASKRKNGPVASTADTAEQDPARLVICPDCGNTVSRRATRCPHCGCPAAVLMNQLDTASDGPVAAQPPAASPAGEAATEEASRVGEPKNSGSRRLYAIAGGVVLLLVMGGVVWWAVQATKPPAVEKVAEQPPPPPPPPVPVELTEEILSPEAKRECIDEASRKMADHIDEVQRQNHLPLALISQTADSAKMLEALASGNLDAIPESTSAIPGGTAVEPYKSQANELFIECRDWVRKNVKQGPCTSTDVWETARRWDTAKQQAVLQPLGGLSVEGLTPAPLPESPQ